MSTDKNPFAQFGQHRGKSADLSPARNPFAQFDPIEVAPIAETPQPAASPHLSTMVKGLPAAALQAHIQAGRGLLQGMSDPVWGGLQLLGHGYASAAKGIAPQSKHAQWAKDQAAKLDRLLADREADYQTKTPSTVAAGTFRLGGQMLPALMMGGVGATHRAATLLSKMGHSAATGSAASILQPTTNQGGDFAAEKLHQALLGGIAGGLIPPATSGLARLLSPNASRNKQLKILLDAGITPTPGRMLGGTIGQLEDKFSSVPVLGDAIRYSQRQAVEDLNRAAYARVLAPIGKTPSKEIGREGIDQLAHTLSQEYEKLLPKLTFQADKNFASEVQRIRQKAMHFLPEPRSLQLQNIIRHQITNKLMQSPTVSGQHVKQVESELGMLAAKYEKSASADERLLGQAVEDLKQALRNGLERTNPEHAKQLANINQAYAQYVRVRNAASRTGSKNGLFTPAQFAAAVRATDSSRSKGQYARGRALMQDLSDAGAQVLGPGYPDSGTAARLLWGAGAMGSGAMLPQIPASLVGLSLPYLPILNRLTAQAITKRPRQAQWWAEKLRQLAPSIGWGAGAQAGQVP